MSSLLIKSGTIIDPSRKHMARGDLLVIDGKIRPTSDLLSRGVGKPNRVIDATGQYVVPGLIDIHTHLREPGDEEEEDVGSGAAAAVAGGFTTICCMPNTRPPLDNEGQVEFILRESERVGLANVFPVGAITKGREGKELAEMALMQQRGAIAFSDDGACVGSAAIMRKALQYGKMLGACLMQHCEEPTLAGGAMHGGLVSTALGLAAIPAESEQLIIARDLLLNRTINCRYHVQHISTATSVQLVREARQRGQAVTAEAAPHHLLLTDEACRSYDTNYKMNPPLRPAADVSAVIDGVKDGTIDCLATDHAPHLAEEKELEFPFAPNGVIGLEAAVALYIKALIQPGHIDWMRLIELMTAGPARVLGLKKGTLAEGADADITIINPTLAWTVDTSRWRTKSRNCPYNGWQLTGRPTVTIVGGSVKWDLAFAQ